MHCRKSHVPVPDAPHTMRQNWIPFLTFFFRRILVYMSAGTVSGSKTAKKQLAMQRQGGIIKERHTAAMLEDDIIAGYGLGVDTTQREVLQKKKY
jgi:hypothetical protein